MAAIVEMEIIVKIVIDNTIMVIMTQVAKENVATAICIIE